MADSGTVYFVIPVHVQLQLDLDEQDENEVWLADDSKQKVPYVGPIEARFKNRLAYVGAIVMGYEVLLGAIPMEDMDLIISPQNQKVDINPINPNYAAAKAK